ncbi:hypothetical protein A3K63_04055 [Candidatus Micrarchaeota archaeon RBG_16_49_10]|nr:MAG: hypothetical protein A3K63_04055 [Candidatus Micrarchaeota archaeon RBG_16_49_10]
MVVVDNVVRQPPLVRLLAEGVVVAPVMNIQIVIMGIHGVSALLEYHRDFYKIVRIIAKDVQKYLELVLTANHTRTKNVGMGIHGGSIRVKIPRKK